MTKEQEKKLLNIDNKLDMTSDDEITISLLYQKADLLEEIIQQLQEENKQKDKTIYLATKFILESGAGRRGFTCCFAKECNKYGCEICIKQYFKKKVSEE